MSNPLFMYQFDLEFQGQALDASIRDSKRQYQLQAFRNFSNHSQTTDTAWQQGEISNSVWFCIRDGFHTSQDAQI